MINAEKRKAIHLLHMEGMRYREIARRLHVGRRTVARIIEQRGEKPIVHLSRRHIEIDEGLLRRLYQECRGYAQRVHEKLREDHHIEISYSSLTQRLRELGLQRGSSQKRCARVPDQPGMEMQHDTSEYKIMIGGKIQKVIASMLYLRYSKRRYLKFYLRFDRFRMKCFIHEALMFWGYSAKDCIIDNTSLARLHGSGATAVIVPEMQAFMEQYDTRFLCHEIGHPDRKAGEERGFWTIETNFFPGRTFVDLKDLNLQAFEWATDRMEQRPLTKACIVPARAFEIERPWLNQLPASLPAPYRLHQRNIDQYGYVAFAANYYWIPGEDRLPVRVLEYADCLVIYRHQMQLIEYPLPAGEVKEQRFAPPGQPAPGHRKRRVKPTIQEEQHLRAMGESIGVYLDAVLPPMGLRRHRFLRRLHALSRSMTAAVFIAVIERAHTHHIADMTILDNIARLLLTQDTASIYPYIDLDEAFDQRDAYLEGSLTDPPDLSVYEQLEKREEDEENK